MVNSPQILSALKQKICDRTAVIGVVGLGYVGLPFAVEKAKVGFKVLGIEQNPEKAARVNRADNYISDVKDEDLKQVVSSGHLAATSNFERVAELDAIVICVPTPLTKNLTPKHLASAIHGQASLFVSTDDRLLKRMRSVNNILGMLPGEALAFVEKWYEN